MVKYGRYIVFMVNYGIYIYILYILLMGFINQRSLITFGDTVTPVGYGSKLSPGELGDRLFGRMAWADPRFGDVNSKRIHIDR